MDGSANLTTGKTARGGAGGEIVLDRQYQIVTGSRLASFEAPGVTAYAVRDLRNASRQLLARVPDRNCMPRLDVVAFLNNMTEVEMSRPVAVGQVDWRAPGGGRMSLSTSDPNRRR
ncbi:MAG: hypothetical protein FJX67_15500 [Alphaproteobacteria bacterium]|nr:hypothetical protein [Alphaproteobacteria bacterium]